MYVVQCLPTIVRNLHIKPRLPNRSHTNCVANSSFICTDDIGNTRRCHDTQKQMDMIRHDHKSKEKERIEMLNPVDRINCFVCICRVFEEPVPVCDICCDKHGYVILKRVTL